MMSVLLLLVGLVASVVGQGCYPPFEDAGGQCIYVEEGLALSWQEARDFCLSIAGDSGSGDLATFPTCDSYTAFSTYLALNSPTSKSLWVGARTVFTINNWEWITGETLQTGATYWAYPDNGILGDCAAADGNYYYRLVDDDCTVSKGFVCGMPSTSVKSNKGDPVTPRQKECPNESILVGDFCYSFHEGPLTWNLAEEKCRKDGGNFGGMLFYPNSCEEFSHMAHHLEAGEIPQNYWVGGIDVTGNQEWTWVNGDLLPGGPPYWASGEPSHDHDNHPNEHCTVMDSTMRYYLRDVHCDEEYPYICRLNV